jgi:hypothetical protein
MSFLLIFHPNEAHIRSCCYFLKKVPQNLPRTPGTDPPYSWSPASVWVSHTFLSTLCQFELDPTISWWVIGEKCCTFFKKFCKRKFAVKLYIMLGFSSFSDMIGKWPRRSFWAHAGCSTCFLWKTRSKKLEVDFKWKKFCTNNAS